MDPNLPCSRLLLQLAASQRPRRILIVAYHSTLSHTHSTTFSLSHSLPLSLSVNWRKSGINYAQ